MSTPMIDMPMDDIIKDYLTGKSVRSLAIQHGVKPATLLQRLNKLGIVRPYRKELPLAEMIAAYQSGLSLDELAHRYHVADSVIRRRLLQNNIQLRTRSEQEQEKWRRKSFEERQRQTVAANIASRGRKTSLETLMQKAQTLQQKATMQPLELQLHQWLHERGISTIPQQAIGPYNCDLGASPVAVEIFGGNWHWHGRHAARLLRRLDYILNAGWAVLTIHVNQIYRPLLPAAADETATYIKRVRSNPTLIGEYRMIRGTGEFVAALRPDSDDFSNILTLTRPLYPGGKHAS